MPTATAPIGKPAGFAKPAGFTKPAGFSRPKDTEEEEEPQKLHPVLLGLGIVAILLMAFLCWMQYSIDQTPGRVTEGLFGKPSTAAAADAGADYASEEAGTEEEAEEAPAEEEESADEEEE